MLSSPLRRAAPGTPQPGVLAKCPNFPAGPAVTRAVRARRAVWHRSHRAKRRRQAGARGVPDLASAGAGEEAAAQPALTNYSLLKEWTCVFY